MTALEVPAIDRRLGPGARLNIAGLSVASGERLVVFGPNGAGKTTLIRVLAGTIHNETGIGGAAYLPQRPYLFRGSVGWNLALGLDAEERESAYRLAADLGVGSLAEQDARSVSGGERQRIALARTLATRLPLVLLDEPLSAIDVRDRMAVASVVAAELAGRTALIVTHDRGEAAALGTTMIVLVAGEVRQQGPVEDVFALPADDLVAEVVGVANVLGGRVESSVDDLVALQCDELVVWGIGTVGSGRPGIALFGAESVTVYPPAASAGSALNTWSGTIVEVRRQGPLVELIVDAGARVAALITPGSLEALGLEEGSEVSVGVKATAVRVVPR